MCGFLLLRVEHKDKGEETVSSLTWTVSDLGSLQVEGLGVVTEQHHILLQVSHTPVFMVPHSILLIEKHLRGGTV